MATHLPIRLRSASLALALLACAPGQSIAQAAPKAPPSDPTADPLMLSAGFLSGHPDLRYRLLGLDEYKQGKLEDALRFFQRAAYHADKPSQAMVAEMYWTGQGAAADKPLAYAWMDLAAERGYIGFLARRERYWSELDESERTRAIAEGQAIYAKYGDAAAQPRLATTLRRGRAQMTGSRTGYTGGNLKIYIAGPAGEEQIDGSKFYDPKYWDPKQYRAWHDDIWMKPRTGRVEVGEAQNVRAPEPTQSPSRVPEVAPDPQAEEPRTPDRNEAGIGTKPIP